MDKIVCNDVGSFDVFVVYVVVYSSLLYLCVFSAIALQIIRDA